MGIVVWNVEQSCCVCSSDRASSRTRTAPD
jgi:hypothetical protein